MQRIQITDNRLVRRIETLARRERRAPQEVIAAAVAAYESQVEPENASAFLLAIAGLGASGQSDVAERADEILAAEIDPLTGWGPRADDSTA